MSSEDNERSGRNHKKHNNIIWDNRKMKLIEILKILRQCVGYIVHEYLDTWELRVQKGSCKPTNGTMHSFWNQWKSWQNCFGFAVYSNASASGFLLLSDFKGMRVGEVIGGTETSFEANTMFTVEDRNKRCIALYGNCNK